jgi:hypothetical protein
LNAAASSTPGQRSHPLSETLDTFPVNPEPELLSSRCRTHPKILSQPGTAHITLFMVDFQSQLLCDEVTDTCHHSAPRGHAFDVDDTVISIANEAQLTALKLLVQLVKNNGAQQGRERTGLLTFPPDVWSASSHTIIARSLSDKA